MLVFLFLYKITVFSSKGKFINSATSRLRSAAMKSPVGTLSDRTVLRSKMEGLCPDKFRFVDFSISHPPRKEHPYMSELALFPAYAAIDPECAI